MPRWRSIARSSGASFATRSIPSTACLPARLAARPRTREAAAGNLPPFPVPRLAGVIAPSALGARRRSHPVVPGHQARLPPRRVVLVDHALAGDLVEHADRIPDRQRRRLGIARLDRQLGLLDEGSGGRPVRSVALSPPLGDLDPLLRGLTVCQPRLPLARTPSLSGASRHSTVPFAAQTVTGVA